MDTLQRTWTDTDGYTVEIYDSLGGTWIRVSGKQREDGTSFGSASPIESVTQRDYVNGLAKMGVDATNYRLAAGRLVRAAAVPFIESVQAEMRARETHREESKSRNVPGLAALRAALDDQERYAEQFAAMMDNESNDGVRPPRPVNVAAAKVAAMYPAAAAYLKAEMWEQASHYAKSSAGIKAKARLAAGDNYEQVLREMESEWSAHTTEHVWD